MFLLREIHKAENATCKSIHYRHRYLGNISLAVFEKQAGRLYEAVY
jgi:hypothetical protein